MPPKANPKPPKTFIFTAPVFHPTSSFALRPSLFAPTPKVKKCKKMVQKRYILVHFCSKSAHF